MALPKLMRDIFANEGAGPLFRKDKIPTIGEADVPSVFVKVAAQTFSDAQKKQARANIGADAIPPGTMMAYGAKSIPDGWLLCNGALVSRKAYSRLFAAIGTAWGAGDGNTTFKLPNADGRVMQGVTDASKIGKYLESALPNITGTVASSDLHDESKNYVGAFAVNGEIVAGNVRSGNVATSAQFKKANFLASKSKAIYSDDTNTVQPAALQTLIIIKA